MRTGYTARLIFAGALLVAALAPAADVKSDYDRGVDFSQFKTYSWDKVETRDPLLVDRIKSAVNASLTAKGWMPMQSGGAVTVIALEMTKEHSTVNTWYDGFGGGWRWGGSFGEATTSVEPYKVGTLVVDLFDAKTKQLIWRGSASDTLSSKSGKNIKDLDKGVDKMFEHFPPTPKH